VILQVVEHRLATDETCALGRGHRIVYDLERNVADYSEDPRALAGALHALAFELVATGAPDALLSAPLEPTPGDPRLMRCDRVDFPPGGVAYRHTHEGPGIRVLLTGTIRIETGGSTTDYAPHQAWFEPGPEPVFAAASESEPTAFVRCMVLPARLRGQSSIRYVQEEDAAKPKPQRYTVFVDQPVGEL
jgi:quercetin dioxygenase-like cupin family protein